MIITLIVFALATFVLLAWVIMKMEQLDEYQDNLDKYSVHLDERANRIAADEETIRQLYKELRDELDKQSKK